MVETGSLERLSASDLFILSWDDFGWSGDIGALACWLACRLDREASPVRRPVWAGQPALQWVGLRPVPADPGSENRADDAAIEIDAANRVVLGVG